MHGLEDLIGYVFFGCLVVALIVQLILNRRPIVVAFAVTIALYLLALAAVFVADGKLDSATASIGFALFLTPGTIGSLIGSGAGRASRLWIAFYREQSASEE